MNDRTCVSCIYMDASIDKDPCKGCCDTARKPNWQAHYVSSPKNAAAQPQVHTDLFLPDDDAVRGDFPMFNGLLAYFPNALAEVSKVSKIGNDQHNPGQPMHWDRSKSRDHENKIMRHLADAGKRDGRGVLHTARLAWRALAMLQEELEYADGLPPSRASRNRPDAR